jgi:hypothetical protein
MIKPLKQHMHAQAQRKTFSGPADSAASQIRLDLRVNLMITRNP